MNELYIAGTSNIVTLGMSLVYNLIQMSNASFLF